MKLKTSLKISALLAFLTTSCWNSNLPLPTETRTIAPIITPTTQCTPTPIKTGYEVGDIGPAGGWIFYDKGYSDGWRYLEAAPVDLTHRAWGTFNYTVTGADGTAIGTGKQNTLDIIAGDSLKNKAANACADYFTINNSVTYDDWFLPSRDELIEMYTNLHEQGIGGFTESSYWSSSEGLPYDAKAIVFNNGLSTHHFKDSLVKSRPIRETN